MTISTWDEIRTAYHVARLGTVSGAADALGVHHATVIRHIDALESQLGVKLFQRHARGYTATEAGQDLLLVAQATDDQFSQLVSRIRGRGEDVGGEIVVTSLSSMAHHFTPILARFQKQNPAIKVRFLTSARLFRLEYGEAHVAIRAGSAPEQPDNVVQRFHKMRIGLYASEEYVKRKGMPKTEAELAEHDFAAIDTDTGSSRAPFARWLSKAVPSERMIFTATEESVVMDAICSGVGIGFVSEMDAALNPGLVQVMSPRDEWTAPLWLVTHVDLHRTSKVQALLKFLKDETKGWSA